MPRIVKDRSSLKCQDLYASVLLAKLEMRQSGITIDDTY